tara:strand:- start:594 stop:1589 length:996 start_codon:yes stop_codon:yes gene_type:complete
VTEAALRLTDAAATPRDRGLDAARRWLVPVAALGCLHPAVGSATALFAGVALALVGLNGYEAQTRDWAKGLLAASVVGLGAGLDLQAVAAVGATGAALAVGSILTCLVVGRFFGRALRVDGTTGLLVTVGTAICGGSAIAAVAPTVRARGHQITAALGTVFLLNAVALVLFPWLGSFLGLSDEQFGLWAAIAIHDTSSVVGAAMTHGERALEIATTVKLARALWIVPLTLLLAWRTRRATSDGEPIRTARPWFIVGFVVVALAVTFVPALRPAGAVVGSVARRLLVVALFLVGASLSRPALRAVGARPFLQGVALWAVISVLSLGGILVLV